MYRTLKPMFEPLDLGIDALALTARGSWQLELDNGAALELGRGMPEEVTARTQRFVQTLNQVASRYGRRPEALVSADLRHGDGYAVRLRGVSTMAEALEEIERKRTAATWQKNTRTSWWGWTSAPPRSWWWWPRCCPAASSSSPAWASPRRNGLKRGVVVNIDATVQSIQQALKEAELMADCKITRVYTGITGSHIRGINSSGMVAVKDQEVTAADVARVVETAQAINISTDQRLLLVEPQEFVIDGQDVKEPIGMSGIRLEAKVHIVTGAQSAAENIIKCVRRCGLEVEHLMLNPLASSLSVLTDDEKELGVALVDIGAGTTDVAIFTNGAIRHTAVIPIAGDLITSDIAMALRTPTKDAEDIKVESGYAKQLLADPEQQVEVPGLGDRGPRMLSPPGAGRRDRAAGGRDLLAGAPGGARIGLRGSAVLRHRAHRRQRGHARHGGTGRGHLPEAGAPRRSQVPRRAGRHGGAAARCHRHGPAGRSAHWRACAASRWRRRTVP